MRPACYDCTRKHLASAESLMTEAMMGYPAHGWLAVGELVQAEQEILSLNPEVAQEIREHRVKYIESLNEQEGSDAPYYYVFPTLEIIDKLTELLRTQSAPPDQKAS